MEDRVTDQDIQLGGVTLRQQGQGWFALVPYYLCAKPSPRGRPLKVQLSAGWTKADLLAHVAPQLAPDARQRFEQALQGEGLILPGQEPVESQEVSPQQHR
jgi:hypothetical protein